MRVLKRSLYIAIMAIVGIACPLHASSPTTTSQPILKSGTITDKTAKQYQGLFDRVAPYPATFVNTDEKTGEKSLHQGLTNRVTVHNIPVGQHKMAKNANLSILRPSGPNKDNFYKNYPTGTTLFPSGYGDIATKFDTVVDALKDNKELIKFFRKIHINILNELYNYLMKIYTNFNLRHVGSKQTSSGIQISVPDYLKDVETYATNKKTLIVNHLVNVIEAQFNSSIQSYVPSIPHLLATHVGKTCIQSDFSIDLTHFILKQESEVLEHLQTTYLTFLANYVAFFEEYTSFLAEHDSTTGFNQFTTIAQHVHAYIHQNGSDKAIDQMDPPMFFYDYDTMRSIRVIPHLANELPEKSESIGWPDTIINAAEKMIMVRDHPVAYFKDADGNITQSQSDATHLYMVIGSGANLYEQELLAQPSWLNNKDGILNILRGCLGDFSALLGMNILDPCTETLIQKAYAQSKGSSTASSTDASSVSQVCRNLIEKWESKDTTVPSSTKSSSSSTSSTTITLPPTTGTSSPTPSPSSDDLTPSSGDLTPSSSNLSLTSGDLSPSSGSITPSGSDISSSLTPSTSSILSSSASSITTPQGA